MSDEGKRKGQDGDPLFDTDQAWDRFVRTVAREPAPDFWLKAQEDQLWKDQKKVAISGDSNLPEYKEGGTNPMKLENNLTEPVNNWRTERPLRRRLRRLITGAAAAVMVIGLFATPLGDRALAAIQQTFRIQHMVGVGISADDMASISELLERGSPDGDRSFSLAQYGSLTQSGGGEAHPIPWAEAEQRMGSSLYKLETSDNPIFQPGTTLTMNLNVKAVNRLLTRLGGTTTLPAEADGKTIRFQIPDGITTEGTLPGGGQPVRLLQFGKPELTVEDGIDVALVREAVLGLPVLPDSLRTKLASIGDWQSTLPVPAREGAITSIRLGGYDAVMNKDSKKRYVLWLNDDRLSLLIGNMKDFPLEADFLQAAEELVRP